MKTCTFISLLTTDTEAPVKELLSHLICEKDVGRVISPMGRGTETQAAEAALALKEEHPVALECFIPFEEQAADWDEDARDRYFGIIEACDREVLLSTRYTDGAEARARLKAVAAADIVITDEYTLQILLPLKDTTKEFMIL